MFNGNALLHISCKLLLGWPWLMPLVSPLFPQCCPQPPDAVSQLLCPVLSTVAEASQPSLGTALPLSLIGESLTRLGPLSRSNIPSDHIDRCAKEGFLHRHLLCFHLIQSNIPNSGNDPAPDSGGSGAFSRAGAGVVQ